MRKRCQPLRWALGLSVAIYSFAATDRRYLVCAQTDAIDALHDALFGWDFAGLETDDLAVAGDDEEIGGLRVGVHGRGAHQMIGLERDFAATAGAFVRCEALHQPDCAFALGAHQEDAAFVVSGSDGADDVTFCQADAETAARGNAPGGKADANTPARGDEDVVVGAGQPAGGGQWAAFRRVEVADAGDHILADEAGFDVGDPATFANQCDGAAAVFGSAATMCSSGRRGSRSLHRGAFGAHGRFRQAVHRQPVGAALDR